jgi:hypothetical protein
LQIPTTHQTNKGHTQRTHGENNTTRAKQKTRTTEENEPDDTEERTPTMIRASSTGLISEPNGKLKAGKTRHRCGQQEDGRRIRARSARNWRNPQRKSGVNKKVERNASLSRVYKGERFFSLLTPLPYFTSHPSILPNSIDGPQALPFLLLLLRLGHSIAVHFDFVLKRTVPISLFPFMCVLESLSSPFLLCLF